MHLSLDLRQSAWSQENHLPWRARLTTGFCAPGWCRRHGHAHRWSFHWWHCCRDIDEYHSYVRFGAVNAKIQRCPVWFAPVVPQLGFLDSPMAWIWLLIQ